MLNYRKEIDGLRALAVVPVIFWHAGFEAFSGGFVGVDIFFVISGYLITAQLLNAHAESRFSILAFYERRARRILPALFLMLSVTTVIAWTLLLPTELKRFSESLVSIIVFASNILFWREHGYFDTESDMKPLLHTWSLSVEEQFYLLFPVFLSFSLRFPKKWVALFLVLLAAISLVIANWGAYVKPAATFFLLPTRAWELFIGSVIAFYGGGVAYRSERIGFHLNNVVCQCAALAGVCLIVYSVFLFDRNTPFPSFYALLPTCGAALIILFASQNTVVGRLLSTYPLVGVGLVSYSAYLWHQPVFAFARESGLTSTADASTLILIAFVFVIAALSWRYLELPFRNVEAVGKPTVIALAVTGSILFATIGAAGIISEGFLSKYSEADQYMLKQHQVGANYVGARFDARRLSAFGTQGKRKLRVLLIGDSYAQDLINAVAEAEMLDHLEISTHYISSRCGNLYLKEDFENLIDPEHRAKCKLFEWSGDWYRKPELQQLLSQADMIWLSSNWTYQQAELLPRSVSNLEGDFGAKVFVFGSKDFSSVQMRALLNLTGNERAAYRFVPSEKHLKLNQLMRSNITNNKFIDIFSLICEAELSCRLFTNEGKLISYDGGHLTLDGAKFVGQELNKLPQFDKFQALEPKL
jgi:peptidoglycan/LPS O-acetylase OafA/YrhL